MLKRFFDIVFSLTGLILLSPLFLIIAIWIKIDSRGPVFFRQERVGRFGNLFKIHKFRTMISSIEGAGSQLTIGQDSRITRSGNFLRRYKLDELPQLIDVIVGKMSLVGPRPEVPKYVAYYPNELKDLILSLRPGITDLASIEYRDENALLGKASNPEQVYINKVLPMKINYYAQYARSNNITSDFLIIANTLWLIVAPKKH